MYMRPKVVDFLMRQFPAQGDLVFFFVTSFHPSVVSRNVDVQ